MTIPIYTQGICNDGAAVLVDGKMLAIDEIVSILNVNECLLEQRQKLIDGLKNNQFMGSQSSPCKARSGKGPSMDASNIFDELLKSPELFAEVNTRISKYIVLNGWTERVFDEGEFERKEPGKIDSRVFVYKEEGGWYYRVGFGVVGIAGFGNEEGFRTAREAMITIDSFLVMQDDIILVDPFYNK